jgi:hypothetical protein
VIYLIGEIALFLLLATLLGLVGGWLLRGLVTARQAEQSPPRRRSEEVEQPPADPFGEPPVRQ